LPFFTSLVHIETAGQQCSLTKAELLNLSLSELLHPDTYILICHFDRTEKYIFVVFALYLRHNFFFYNERMVKYPSYFATERLERVHFQINVEVSNMLQLTILSTTFPSIQIGEHFNSCYNWTIFGSLTKMSRIFDLPEILYVWKTENDAECKYNVTGHHRLKQFLFFTPMTFT